jgi:hypothetical protein
MKRKCIIILFIFLVSAAIAHSNYNVLLNNTDSESEELQPYCGYALIYPIVMKWDTYSWVEKRNYQAFFQNILAAYKFSSYTSDDILFYISPEYVKDIEIVKNLVKQLVEIRDGFKKQGWIDEKKDIKVPFKMIIYLMPLNISSVVLPIDGKLIGDSYEDLTIIIINANKIGKALSEPCILAHAYAHSLIGVMKGESGYWLEEAIAAYLETSVGKKCSNLEPFYEYRLEHPEISIGAYDSKVAVADSKFISLLENENKGIIKSFINEGKTNDNAFKSFIDYVNNKSQRSIFDYYEEYAIGNLYPLIMKGNLGDEINDYPYMKEIVLDRLSAGYSVFAGNQKIMGLKFNFETSHKLSVWVFSYIEDRGVSLYKIENILEKVQDNVFPITKGSKLYLLYINNNIEEASLKMDVMLVEGYPCIVEVFQLDEQGNDVVINWLTSKEIETYGWSVYRKAEDEKDYIKVNNYIIPAAGNSNEAIRYMYIDKGVSKGKKYYYFIGVVTKKGFYMYYPPMSIKLR